MLNNLLTLAIVALVLYAIWYLVSLFLSGVILTIIGAILIVVFIIRALAVLGISI